MDDIIQGRKKEITQIETIMMDINAMAKDLALETTKQGQSLQRLDTNVTVARDNTKHALIELTVAKKNQKTSGKCLAIILGIIVVIVAIILAIVLSKSN